MVNLIEDNSFRILGLTADSSQKNVLKRYKEIINRLKIDDYPEYDVDISLPKNYRTIEVVTDALKRLQAPKSLIKEYFFWFQVSDSVDKTALELIQKENYDDAIQIWNKTIKEEDKNSLLSMKNLAIFYCLLLTKKYNEDYLKKSLSLWKTIVNSDIFWKAYTTSYEKQNEQTVSAEIISGFRKEAGRLISDVYTDLCQRHKNSKIVESFKSTFSVSGEKTEKNLLNPIYQTLYETIEELDGIKFEDKGVERKFDNKDFREALQDLQNICSNCGQEGKYNEYDDDSVLCQKCHKEIGEQWQKIVDEELEETVEGSQKTVKKIQKAILKLQMQLNKLQKTGSYDDDRSKVVRDRVAEAIRSASVLIHNETHMYGKSTELLKLAIKLSGTESLREKCVSDLKIIKKNANYDEKSSMLIEIPGFWSKRNILFKNNFVEYDDKKIYYKDVTAMSYHGVRNSTYGIETSRQYTFSIVSPTDEINFTFSGDTDLWGKLIGIVSQVIEPIIIKKLVKRIFEDKETLSIGSVRFDEEGYHKTTWFGFGSPESVLWSDTIYIPAFSQGDVILFKDKHHFSGISMKESNAVVLPELLKACVNEYGLRHSKIR